jgi:AcrR family transcriptional regulator
VSPARARTSDAEVVAAGRAILEAGGLDALTMQAVARQVGVRAPSLYKRFPSRGALVAAIGADAFDELGDRLRVVDDAADPAAALRSMAIAYRRFAHDHPRAYGLLFADLEPEARPAPEHNAAAAGPLLALTARLVGTDRSLEAARLLTAFVHGFVSMELSGSFRLGGDVDAAFRFGIDVLVDALPGDSSTKGDARPVDPSRGTTPPPP